jgi:hypothetical protein
MINKVLISCVFKSQPLTKLKPYMMIFRKRMWTLRVVTRIQLFVKKHLGNSSFWYSQLSCDTLLSTAAFMASSLSGVSATWTTSIHNRLRKHTSCLTKTLLRSSKHTRVWMTSTRITYFIYHRNRYPFDYYKYRRLRALRSKSRLHIR